MRSSGRTRVAFTTLLDLVPLLGGDVYIGVFTRTLACHPQHIPYVAVHASSRRGELTEKMPIGFYYPEFPTAVSDEHGKAIELARDFMDMVRDVAGSGLVIVLSRVNSGYCTPLVDESVVAYTEPYAVPLTALTALAKAVSTGNLPHDRLSEDGFSVVNGRGYSLAIHGSGEAGVAYWLNEELDGEFLGIYATLTATGYRALRRLLRAVGADLIVLRANF